MKNFILSLLLFTGLSSAYALNPTGTYCSTDAGVTWTPCTPSGGGGSATAANQATQITAEQAIQTSTATIATNSASEATAARQDTGNSSLATIATNTTQQRGASAASSSVAMTGVSTQLLAANANRYEAIISNTSGVSCNIGLGTTASATTGPVLAANATFIEDRYTGAINSLCASGSIAVTEITP